MTPTRLLLMVFLLNALTVAGGVGALYVMLKPHLSVETQQAAVSSSEPAEYDFFPVERVIVSLRGEHREHYFVLDLMLLSEASDEPRDFSRIEPIVRNSAIAYLSSYQYDQLRALSLNELQERLQNALLEDLARKRVEPVFDQVLISKMLVQ